MSAIVCGKRSNFFEDLQSPSSSPSSPPVPKRIRCSPSSFSPPRSSNPPLPAANCFSAIDHLLSFFPDMDKQLLEKALEECGDDLDSAIKRLNELRLGSVENLGPVAGGSDASLEARTQILAQGNGGPAHTEDASAAKGLHMESTEWVELFVREMMSASNIDDAKARASRALEVLEKSICARTTEATARDVQQRAFAIQRERQKEFEDRGLELNQLKQLVAQYQEQLRTLEVNNYALSMHLKQAQQSNSIPGRFHPDVF